MKRRMADGSFPPTSRFLRIADRQGAEHFAFAAGTGFELQNGMIDAKLMQQLMPNFFLQGVDPAQPLIRHHHVAGKGNAR